MNNSRTKVRKAEFEEFAERETDDINQNLEFLEGNNLEIRFELGRTSREIRDIISLEKGSIIKLDKTSGDNVDIRLKDDYIAKGEVVLIDNTYGIRITGILDGE
jgi:flagellar motor switch protein FliN/FliY